MVIAAERILADIRAQMNTPQAPKAEAWQELEERGSSWESVLAQGIKKEQELAHLKATCWRETRKSFVRILQQY